MHRGQTLIELVTALATVACMAAIAGPRIRDASDRAAVRAARLTVLSTVALAREEARNRSAPVALAIDAARARLVVVTRGGDPLLGQPVGDESSVALHATGDTVRFAPSGAGYGVSNTTITLERGNAVDSIIISRLGRVRW